VSERLSSSIVKAFWSVSVLLVIATIGCGMWFGIRRTSPAVSLRMVRRTNDVAGVPAVLFQITNGSHEAFTCTYQTQVQSNGLWWSAVALGIPPRSAIGKHSLPGKSAFDVLLAAPVPGMKWRVLVFYNEPPGTVRSRMDSLLQRIGLPVRMNRKTFVIGQELGS
jgi:hypothetical protein